MAIINVVTIVSLTHGTYMYYQKMCFNHLGLFNMVA